MMSKYWVPFWVTLAIWMIAAIALWVTAGYFVHRDTTGWLNRAQVSSHAVDMQEYLQKTVEGMEERDLTDGHAAFVFRTPDNDMELVMKATHRAIERLEELKVLAVNSVEYQTGLDDVRGVIRELDIQAPYRYCVGHWLWFWYSALIGWLIASFGFIYAAMNSKW